MDDRRFADAAGKLVEDGGGLPPTYCADPRDVVVGAEGGAGPAPAGCPDDLPGHLHENRPTIENLTARSAIAPMMEMEIQKPTELR